MSMFQSLSRAHAFITQMMTAALIMVIFLSGMSIYKDSGRLAPWVPEGSLAGFVWLHF